ncbi:Transmembrane protein 200A [Larimichthys crocea]|uniref:Transmembrane protein 200A n=1 Tax=Larimichthys crocea TaxID=215358 RepID=A0A0F8APT7_LARCR|nr:transmembrane protein 200A [Larimichthys crocea]KAE8281763.1 Transmembrane protein 200A [Larimichthys crocea]
MKTQKARDATTTSPTCRGKSRFTLRGRKKKDGVIQGKLRIRSMPGAFLVLGVIVVVVGTALAVAGYWPYRIARSSILGAAEGESISESQTSGWSLGAKGFLSAASLIHSERMKLLGPVIMGVGLFILICANTVLYENRDRETQMLLAQMRSVMCSVSTVIPSAELKEIAATNSMATQYQWVSTLPATHLNILCLQQLTSSEPLLQTKHLTDQEGSVQGIYQQAVLQTDALHHQELESPPSSLHSSLSNSHNSKPADFKTQSGAEHRGSTSFNPQSIPLMKLNNCLVCASSMSTLGVDEVDIPASQPRRCHSMSYRTNPFMARTVVHLEERFHTPREEGQMNQLVVREAGSQVCINILEHVADAGEERTHQSWPQLDLSSCRRYLKLENKEDSVDKLLDQLEKQCSQWDRSFGSGPFQ